MTALDQATINRLVEVVSQEISQMLKAEAHTKSMQSQLESCSDCLGQCAQECPDRILAAMEAGAARFTANLGISQVSPQVAHFIDHTLLKPEATIQQVTQLCHEALLHQFASVCVNPSHVKLAAQLLQGSAIKVCTVVGFPLGATSAQSKAFEAKQALQDGATEIDMVINIGALKGGENLLVEQDIAGVVQVSHQQGVICKVIIETALLSDEEKVRACQLAKKAGADFVKTSTGFSSGGATIEDVSLMRQTVGPVVGVKASGGIRNLQDAQRMIEAGATRLGASAGVKIVQEAQVL